MEIVVLSRDEIETLCRRVADAAVQQLRDELASSAVRELMTMSQICDYLGCHRSTIAKHIKNGMPVERLGDDPRFRKSDIDLWLKGEWVSTKNITAKSSPMPRTQTGHAAPGTSGNGFAAG